MIQIKNKKIILFDGVCNLCNDAVNFIIKHDKNIIRAGEWFEIIDNIVTISKCKRNTWPSITNKAIFKHLDIVDLINK